MGHFLPTAVGSVTDGDLVIAAQHGDAIALGTLLQRHRAHLLASAMRLVGHTADAEDAVQETFLQAMRYIGDVRDPDAVGAWLHAVLRRACLQLRRREREAPLVGPLPDVVDEREDLDARLERLALRDWIWNALERLPEAIRVSATLRYFGSYDSYEEIAAILGVPIGTVRSRLATAKTKLANALLESAGLAHDERRRRLQARADFWSDAFCDIFKRGSSTPFVSRMPRSVAIRWSHGIAAQGRDHLATEIEGDLAAGVRIDLERVLVNDGVAVLEGRFVNPTASPEHCPPGIALVLFESDERVSRVRLHLSPRAPRPLDE